MPRTAADPDCGIAPGLELPGTRLHLVRTDQRQGRAEQRSATASGVGQRLRSRIAPRARPTRGKEAPERRTTEEETMAGISRRQVVAASIGGVAIASGWVCRAGAQSPVVLRVSSSM